MRTILWAVAAVAAAAGLAALAARSRADDAVPEPAPNAHLKTEALDYKDGDVVLKGHLAHDPTISSLRPAVLVVHDWWGQGEFARATAERVAGWGYVALAVDMYGDGKRTDDPKEAGALSGQFRGDGRMKGRARIQAAMKALEGLVYVDHARTACLGFCFGGTVSLELAYSGAPIRGAVSFHGHPTAPRAEDAWTADLLVLHGGDDPFVPAEALTTFQEALRKVKGEYEIDVFSGALHSFTDPGVDAHGLAGAKFDARAAGRAFARCQDFLQGCLAR